MIFSLPREKLLSLFLLVNCFVTGEILFPSESSELIRLSRDVLFVDQDNIYNSSVIASFHPRNPSPTLSSPPIGISKVRFIDTDQSSDSVPGADILNQSSLPLTQEFIPIIVSDPALTGQRSGRDEKSVAVAVSTGIQNPVPSQPSEEERWPWPSTSLIGQQGRQLKRQDPSLTARKSVPKPYRAFTKVSSCPKLLHDLNLSCELKQHQPILEPVFFQWRKTLYDINGQNPKPIDQIIKIPIAHGANVLIKDPRYSVVTTTDSTTLSIRQLRVSDCGSYTCEVFYSNGTLVTTTDMMIFLCF